MPAVFFASIKFVAREDVAHALARFDDVDLVPCVWEKIYDLPVDEKSVRELMQRFSVFGDEFEEWHSSILRPASAEQGQYPKYYEVLCPPLAGLQGRFPQTTVLNLPSPVYEEMPPVKTSGQLHAIYPMVKHTPYILCVEDVFRVLQPHITDPDMFTVLPIEAD